MYGQQKQLSFCEIAYTAINSYTQFWLSAAAFGLWPQIGGSSFSWGYFLQLCGFGLNLKQLMASQTAFQAWSGVVSLAHSWDRECMPSSCRENVMFLRQSQ